MKDPRIPFFNDLKRQIELEFRKSFPEHSASIKDWKGKEIRDFQNELRDKTSGYISEKWFYTHIKKESTEKLPRNDMLCILSRYVGYEDWEDFLSRNQRNIPQNDISETESKDNNKRNRSILMVGLLSMMLIYISSSFFVGGDKEGAWFCIIDADTKESITFSDISVQVLGDGESPLAIDCDSTSCFHLEKEQGSKVKFVISALYYQTDTITRIISQSKETISLKLDDYALMLHYFSNTKIEDWEKRRQQLDLMISNNARIIQVSSINQKGMEMYNKTEFIDKMTVPINSLKNIKVLETKYQEDQIVYMRFMTL